MKKLAGLIFVVFLFSGIVSAANGKVMLNLYGSFLSLAENSYTDQASRNKVYFETKAAARISGNFYIWASHGYFPLHDSWDDWTSKAVFAADISVERTLSKRVVAAGCGFFAGYFEQNQVAIRTEVGICSITNDIESKISDIHTGEFLHTESAGQSGIGVRANLAVTCGLYKKIFGEIEAGFMYASDKIDAVRSNLGGFHLALGLGIQL